MVMRSLDVTRALGELRAGDAGAGERLLPLVYAELRDLADARMRSERGDHTLQATALVHEAWMRLLGGGDEGFDNRAHFFAAAGRAMRRVLVEHARSVGAEKRGGRARRVTLDAEGFGLGSPEAEVTAVDLALARLEIDDPRKARVVELRFFAGLSVEETATALELSPRTVKREWAFARAWLYREIRGGAE